jgi:death-on-curing protein
VSEREIEYLDLDDLLSLATALLGDPVPVRDLGLLGAAAARPSASAFGESAYPDLWSKAAALLHSIVSNHALVDGNKRLGWVACAVFLDLNGVDPTVATNDDVFDLVMQVASEPIDVAELAPRLQSIIERRGDGVSRTKPT